MREFFDASELVAAFWRGHPSHDAASLRFVSTSWMTALPVKETIPPAQALFFVDEVRARFTPVGLDSEEYYRTITDAAKRDFSSGRVYDCLLLGCAVKIDADVISTWNLKQ